jgi:prenyltransferase beta subunit
MALKFLKSLPEAETDPRVIALIIRIEQILKDGYEKLITYQTPEGGYEWFGQSPAHEALSAMGLAQFSAMASVTPFVDQAMVDKLKNWILSRKNGEGGF